MSALDRSATYPVKEIVIRERPHWIKMPPALQQRLRDALSQPVPRRKMSYQEFLDWADEDTLAEWVDGEVVMTSPASRKHQTIVGFLGRVIGPYVEQRGLRVVLNAPFQMKLASSGREPDLLFVSSEHLDRLQETFLDGPADMVVEIVSPESMDRDRNKKFCEYEAGGVQEYWLIDPLVQQAEFYHLDAGGRYRMAFAGREGVYHSVVLPGFWLQVEWLWQDPLPDIEMTVWEILGYESVVRRLAQAVGIEELRRLLKGDE